MIKCALQTNTIQIKHNKLRIPTGGRLTSWLFTRRGGVEFGATEDKSTSLCKKKDNRPVTESLIYLYSQQPLACGVGSCQNGGSCVEECDGNRKCICTGGYTGAHCENTLSTETLRKKLNRNLSFCNHTVLAVSSNHAQGLVVPKTDSQSFISIHVQFTQSEYSSKVIGELARTFE